jgi:hypothetical protein
MLRKILTDVDSLLDTRIGVLSTLYPAAASTLVASKAYWLREHTDWSVLTDGKVSNEQFAQAWAKRTKRSACESSVMNGFHPVFIKILTDVAAAGMSGMSDFDVGFEVNLHPYDFTFDELELFTVLIRKQVGQDVPITFCSIPLEDLTPELMLKEYSACISFNFHEWIKLHAPTLANIEARGFNYVAPKLFETDPRSMTVDQKEDELTRWRLYYLHAMDFAFIDVKYFSMFRLDVMS